MFDLRVIGQKKVLYDDAVRSVRLDGADSEYEFLSFHIDAVGVLRKGYVIIDNRLRIPIRSGVVTFVNNKCLVLCDEI